MICDESQGRGCSFVAAGGSLARWAIGDTWVLASRYLDGPVCTCGVTAARFVAGFLGADLLVAQRRVQVDFIQGYMAAGPVLAEPFRQEEAHNFSVVGGLG